MAFEVKDIVLVGVYATCPQCKRVRLLESIIKKYNKMVDLIGDFNMVKVANNTYCKLVQVISRAIKKSWTNIKNRPSQSCRFVEHRRIDLAKLWYKPTSFKINT